MTQKEMYDYCKNYISNLLKQVEVGKILMFKKHVNNYQELCHENFVFNEEDLTVEVRIFFFDIYSLCNHDVETEEEYKKDLDNLFHIFTREKM